MINGYDVWRIWYVPRLMENTSLFRRSMRNFKSSTMKSKYLDVLELSICIVNAVLSIFIDKLNFRLKFRWESLKYRPFDCRFISILTKLVDRKEIQC